MKFNLKNRCLRAVLIVGSMLRIKHWRGHGVHSPFAYSLVRQVFMKRNFRTGSCQTYINLRDLKIKKRWARQIQNLENYCTDYKLNIIEPQSPITAEAHPDKTIVCILHPRASKKRFLDSRNAINSHPGMSIDNRAYILLINNKNLPKQHFKL